MDKGNEGVKPIEEQVVSSDIVRRRAQAKAGNRSTGLVTKITDAHVEKIEAQASEIKAKIMADKDIMDERDRLARANLLRKNNSRKGRT